MGRILAIDYGTRRCGLAVTDTLQIVPGALETVPTPRLLDYLVAYCQREEVELFLFGKPTQMDYSPSSTWGAIQKKAQQLSKRLPHIPIQYVDERFTSVLAQRAILASGIKKSQRRQDKGLVDRVSATLILQTFLESRSLGF